LAGKILNEGGGIKQRLVAAKVIRALLEQEVLIRIERSLEVLLKMKQFLFLYWSLDSNSFSIFSMFGAHTTNSEKILFFIKLIYLKE
jgi:translation initiation factor RLI1